MYGAWVLVIMIIVSSLPVIAVYVWYRIAKYPISLVKFFIALLIGAAAIFPALILQNLLSAVNITNGRAALFYNYFFRIAFTEEFSRMMFLFIFFLIIGIYKTKENSENAVSWNILKTGTALGFVAGLGFAVLETAVYTVAASMDVSILLLRAVTAAPLHAACGSRVGAAAVLIRSNPAQTVFRLLAAACIHGIYNLMITMRGFPAVMAILIAITALISAILTIKGSWTEANNE